MTPTRTYTHRVNRMVLPVSFFALTSLILHSCDSPPVTETSGSKDTTSPIECTDTSTEPPVGGCPCENDALGGLRGCCTRLSNGTRGWECDGTWRGYSPTGCDGNPATCPPCPLCPEAWEPDR